MVLIAYVTPLSPLTMEEALNAGLSALILLAGMGFIAFLGYRLCRDVAAADALQPTGRDTGLWRRWRFFAASAAFSYLWIIATYAALIVSHEVAGDLLARFMFYAWGFISPTAWAVYFASFHVSENVFMVYWLAILTLGWITAGTLTARRVVQQLRRQDSATATATT